MRRTNTKSRNICKTGFWRSS